MSQYVSSSDSEDVDSALPVCLIYVFCFLHRLNCYAADHFIKGSCWDS